MPKNEGLHFAILVISGAEQFDAIVKRSLPAGLFTAIDVRRSAATARRGVLERYYDIVVINSPLPDETGIDLAMDIAEKSQASVLVVSPAELYEDVLERVTDSGILAVSKPFPRGRIEKALRLLAAFRRRISELERKTASVHEKMEEMRIVSRAKFLLMEQKHMTEDEAHRFIGKQAMNNGVSRKAVARRVIEDLEE